MKMQENYIDAYKEFLKLHNGTCILELVACVCS